jgi:tRNA A37 N6-isopentenylltransferase MiaA
MSDRHPLPPHVFEPCLVICGPTGAGKTGLAMALADEIDLLVVSADSRQIYRGFDLGTAKPSPADRNRVPHACLDLVEPTMRYTAYAWAGEAERAARKASSDERVPVVVGGAGFYVRALVHPVTKDAPAGEERFVAHYLVVDPGPRLHERLVRRVATMVSEGWVEEVERLVAVVPADAPAWQASGYSAMREYVRGERSLEDAIDRIVIATRQYAKRQRTWFRHQLPADRVTNLDPGAPGAVAKALSWVRTLAGPRS